jgi:protein-tyrosine phosphatase
MAPTPGRVLTVCTGNICRSPFLERALQADLDRSWGSGRIEVSSGGTGALAGHPMEDQARALLQAHGYSADGFVARDLTAAMVADADLVLTATRAHRSKVMALHPRAVRYTFTFREFAHLVSSLTDAELADSELAGSELAGSELAGEPTAQPTDDPDDGSRARDHLARVVALAAGQRGVDAPLTDSDADVVDPYRRPVQVFREMTDQIMGSLPAVVRALRRPQTA